MIVTGNGNSPRENNARLSEMVQRELEALTFRKERYDMTYPGHVKCLTKPEMKQIAREKVVEELCMLPSCPEECSDFGECHDNPDKCGFMGR